MQTGFSVRFIVMGPCQNTQRNFSLLPICNNNIVCGFYFGVYGNHLLIARHNHNLHLPQVMSFLLVTHLPWLVMIVANFFKWERKVSNFNLLFLLFYLFFTNNQGKQHKMLKKRPVATGWLQTICVFLHKNIT